MRNFWAALAVFIALVGLAPPGHAGVTDNIVVVPSCGTASEANTGQNFLGYATVDTAGRLCGTSSSGAAGEFDVPLTPTVQASSYSSGNAIGALQTIPAFRLAGGTGILNNVSVWSKGGSTTAITIYLFTANPTSSTCNGATAGNAFSLAAADISKLVAAIPVVLTPAVVGAGTTATTASQQLPVAVKNGDSTVNLYACAVVGGTVTPGSTTDLVFTYAGVQD